ncbi:ECF transporter S component [Murdochiella vaginalis]|uniref:ECF transporter S component n=1 Tax=Murdochiella vaginalis TaxID=1852373 RepID=UPI0008FE15D1|nr:ECF transporter S component [Murdochiella vaginalis]
MKNKFFNGRNLARLGVLIALMLVLSALPIGYILIGPIQVTTMHIPVVLGAIIGGVPYGFILGLAFGLNSMLRALQGLSGPLSFAFANPLISVLPRVLFGVIVGYLATIWRNKNVIIRYSLPAIIGTVMHTLMVMGTLYLVYAARVAEVRNITSEAVGAMVLTTVVANGIPEAILAAVVSTPIARILEKREHRKPLNDAQEEETSNKA